MPAERLYKVIPQIFSVRMKRGGETRAQLCERAGITDKALDQILLGGPVNWETIEKAAEALGIYPINALELTEVIDPAIRLLRQQEGISEDDRQEFMSYLKNLRFHNAFLCELIDNVVTGEEIEERRYSIRVLKELGTPFAEIVNALEFAAQCDEDEKTRTLALDALKYIKSEEYVEILNKKISNGLIVEVKPRGQGGPVPPLDDKIREVFSGLPEDIEQRAAALDATHLAYRQEYAAQLEPIINVRIRDAIESGTSYDDKKKIIKSINEELRLGGLAVQYEAKDAAGNVTVHPGYLVIGTSRHEGGRFRVEYQEAGEKESFGISGESPSIKLMPAPAQHGRKLAGPEAKSFAGRVTAERSTHTTNHLE